MTIDADRIKEIARMGRNTKQVLSPRQALVVALLLIVSLAAQNRSPVAPADERLKTAVKQAYSMYKSDAAGNKADYIPYLAHLDSKLFGIAVVTTDNKCYMLGDTAYSFSIQSISQVFTLALAMQEHGFQTVFEKIGTEPTGRPFNSVEAVFAPGRLWHVTVHSRPSAKLFKTGPAACSSLDRG